MEVQRNGVHACDPDRCIDAHRGRTLVTATRFPGLRAARRTCARPVAQEPRSPVVRWLGTPTCFLSADSMPHMAFPAVASGLGAEEGLDQTGQEAQIAILTVPLFPYQGQTTVTLWPTALMVPNMYLLNAPFDRVLLDLLSLSSPNPPNPSNLNINTVGALILCAAEP